MFVAYAIGLFTISGGVVFILGHAALVGLIAAGLAGYARTGLGPAWLLPFASVLGYHAAHAFLGLPHRSVPYRLKREQRHDEVIDLLEWCIDYTEAEAEAG